MRGLYIVFKVGYWFLLLFMLLVSIWFLSTEMDGAINEGDAFVFIYLVGIGFWPTYLLGIINAWLGRNMNKHEKSNALIISVFYAFFILLGIVGRYLFSFNAGIIFVGIHLVLIGREIWTANADENSK